MTSEQNQNKNNATSDNKQNHPTLLAVNKQIVLLQTIYIEVSDDKNLNSIKVKVLFDPGSTKTYVSQRIVDLLSLTPVSTQGLYVNSFGSNKGKFMNVSSYNLCLKGRDGNLYYINGSAVPVICAPLHDREAIEAVKVKFPFVENVIEGRKDEITSDDIDVLIGSEYYWSFINGDSIRLDDKLVLLNSKFGYLLSGPLKNDSIGLLKD